MLKIYEGEDQYAEYLDLEAAKKDGAIERGWIPEWTPQSARKLREWHNLDTNLQSLTFFIPSEESDDFQAMLGSRGFRGVPPDSVDLPSICEKELAGHSDVQVWQGYQPPLRYIVAIAASRGYVCAWSTHL